MHSFVYHSVQFLKYFVDCMNYYFENTDWLPHSISNVPFCIFYLEKLISLKIPLAPFFLFRSSKNAINHSYKTVHSYKRNLSLVLKKLTYIYTYICRYFLYYSNVQKYFFQEVRNFSEIETIYRKNLYIWYVPITSNKEKENFFVGKIFHVWSEHQKCPKL